MRRVAPAGDVYQAGTLSGNPLAVAAGLATLERLEEPGVYDVLEARSRTLADGLAGLAREAGVELTTAAVGGMFGFFFQAGPVRCFADAKQSREDRFRSFFGAMLDSGINLAPSPYEAGFVSLAHTKKDIDRTLEAARNALLRSARIR
jgi:glutamate-1-semialdehyde 2,1-aminomutase